MLSCEVQGEPEPSSVYPVFCNGPTPSSVDIGGGRIKISGKITLDGAGMNMETCRICSKGIQTTSGRKYISRTCPVLFVEHDLLQIDAVSKKLSILYKILHIVR
mmetsp:Transcript_21138/g.42326  ORF Transcript_21138/g.42326 Transcript_21138/m.42326 type:complete len:104 (-) Transcript_21138:328-639(-)